MKINEVIQFEDENRRSRRMASLDRDGDKLMWKNILKNKDQYDAFEFELSGVDQKAYIDNGDGLMYIFDPAIGGFVQADISIIRQVQKQRVKAQKGKGPTLIQKIKNLFDPTDPTQPGAASAMKYATKPNMRGALTPNFNKALGMAGARVGGVIDRMRAKRRSKQIVGDVWKKVYGIAEPKAGDEIVYKNKNGEFKTAKAIGLDLKVDRDGDGVPDLLCSTPDGKTQFALISSQVLSVNGMKIKRGAAPEMPAPLSSDPGDARIPKIDTSF